MSKLRNAALVVAMVAVGASAARAQMVALYGEFHESNGIVLNIPHNPPIVPCIPPPLLVSPPAHATIWGTQVLQHVALRPTGENDARCPMRGQYILFNQTAPICSTSPGSVPGVHATSRSLRAS